MRYLKGIILLIFIVQLILFSSVAIASDDYAQTFLNTSDWDSDESNFFIIYYHPTANLEAIEKNISTKKLYFDQPVRYGEVTASQEICYRLDKLLNQVEDVLGMYPKMPKIKIVIFKDKDELNKECLKMLGSKDCSKSYYVNKYETIYTSENDIEDSVIVHEMAHAVIDHYFSANPPEIISEILASYVDMYFEK